ncbi:hypothetical protein HBI68_255410 [Parastagonospora nodorum]|nr:hypothetical protein HBI68_255410 [Parastagonospora nodorum]KAH6383061.1 hypothetical protein HBI60_258960 [Parastagonospora nodorum]
MVKLLIHHGASINVTGGFYGSALQAACWKGSEQVVETLLQAGANPGIQGRECDSAFVLALERRDLTICRLLCIWIIGNKVPMLLKSRLIASS